MTASSKAVPLFRREAVLHRTDAIFGGILLPQPKWQTYLVRTIVIVLASLFGVVLTATYTKRSQASGWIALAPGPAAVSVPTSGVVGRILVVEGQAVAKGQLLIEISRARSSTALRSVEDEISRRLQDEKANILQQIEIEASLSTQARSNADSEIAALERNLDSMRRSNELAMEKLSLAQSEYQRTQQLVGKNWLPRKALDEAKETLLAAQITMQDGEQRLNEQTDRLRAKVATRSAMPLQMQQRLSDLQAKIAALERQDTEIKGSAASAIYAPISGFVTGLNANVGDSVNGGSPLLNIVPEHSLFRAELLVPSRDAGFLQKDMEVWIRFDAFPYQRFGQHRGRVRSVDLTVLTPDQQTGPVRLNEPAYRVIVELERQSISAYGREIPLQSGLTFVAAISQESRRLTDLVLDPIRAAGRGLY